jgi:hypothetical protein
MFEEDFIWKPATFIFRTRQNANSCFSGMSKMRSFSNRWVARFLAAMRVSPRISISSGVRCVGFSWQGGAVSRLRLVGYGRAGPRRLQAAFAEYDAL